MFNYFSHLFIFFLIKAVATSPQIKPWVLQFMSCCCFNIFQPWCWPQGPRTRHGAHHLRQFEGWWEERQSKRKRQRRWTKSWESWCLVWQWLKTLEPLEFEINWCNCAHVSSWSLLVSTFAAWEPWVIQVCCDHARPMHFPYFRCQVSYKMRRQQLQAVAGRGNADGEWMGMDWNISLYFLISIYGCHMVSRVFFTCYNIFCYFLVGFVTFEIKPRVSFWGEPTI